jgi:hypothetical protein
MPSVEQIVRWKDALVATYGERDRRYANIENAYNGEYDKITGLDMSTYDGRDFRNYKSNAMQVWNFCKPVVDSTVMQIARLPEIEVAARDRGNPLLAAQAEKLEKMYYALWDLSDMQVKHGLYAHYIALYNSGCLWVRPDAQDDVPKLLVRKPGLCYPVPLSEGERDFRFVIFTWMQDGTMIDEKDLDMMSAVNGTQSEIIEYIDKSEYVMLVNGKPYRRVQHDFGFCPVRVTPGFDTGELFPRSTLEQVVGNNIYLNKLQTQLADGLEETIYQEKYFVGGEERPVNTGPGAVNWLDSETKPFQFPSPHIPSEMFTEAARTEDFIRTVTNWSHAMSGDMQGSVITGKAVSRLQGPSAGMASLHQYYMGTDLQKCNEYMARMMDVMWPKKEFYLQSKGPIVNTDPYGYLSPGRKKDNFVVTIIPEQDIHGYYANTCIYTPTGSELNASIVASLQLLGADVISLRMLRNSIPGVGDAEAMAAEVEEEKRKKMKLELDLQGEAQKQIIEMQTQAAIQQQQAATGQSQGAGAAAPPGAGPEGGNAPPNTGGSAPNAPANAPGVNGPIILPGGQPNVMGEGAPFTGAENFPLPFTQVKPFGQVLNRESGGQGGSPNLQSEALPGRTVVSVEEVKKAFASATNRKGGKATGKLQGEVYLTGEIAQRGYTDGNIQFAITVKADQQVIVNALPQWASQNRLQFAVIDPGVVPPGAVPLLGKEPTTPPIGQGGPQGGLPTQA